MDVSQEDVDSSYKAFLQSFLEKYPADFGADDPLPLRLITFYLSADEVEGELLDWILQWLEKCAAPWLLAAALARHTVDEFLSQDLAQYHRQAEEEQEEQQQPQLEAERLAKAAFNRIRGLCNDWSRDGLPTLQPCRKSLPESSLCSIKNTRRRMEDRHLRVPDLNFLFNLKDQEEQCLYGVFDGHGGIDAANYTAAHLYVNIVRHPSFHDDVETALRESNLATDAKFCEKAKQEGLRSGSTAVIVLIRDSTLYVSWCGDSSAMVIRKERCLEIMEAHKPEREDERKRIEDLGGCVVHYGTWRVNGNLSVSRAIGDASEKPYISGEADVTKVPLDGSEEYLIVGCDGFWEHISHGQITDTIQASITKNEGSRQQVAKDLVAMAKDNGSSDNITVIAVSLGGQHNQVDNNVGEGDAPKTKDDDSNPNGADKDNSESGSDTPNSSSSDATGSNFTTSVSGGHPPGTYSANYSGSCFSGRFLPQSHLRAKRPLHKTSSLPLSLGERPLHKTTSLPLSGGASNVSKVDREVVSYLNVLEGNQIRLVGKPHGERTVMKSQVSPVSLSPVLTEGSVSHQLPLTVRLSPSFQRKQQVNQTSLIPAKRASSSPLMLPPVPQAPHPSLIMEDRLDVPRASLSFPPPKVDTNFKGKFVDFFLRRRNRVKPLPSV
ncbi:protein phosphatase 1F-like [Branchiostoma floridae]|uniref:Protein phosphatase 1E n=2 Tax=Branchiostoma floridae TaxID=7739 RepID=A0A9J7N710_BRAFL|nr:protein phosphatase 1F-like [Branchiostoma floridae]